MIPDFIIAGFPRCGTTSIFHYLKKHPQILLPYSKETNFFQRDWHKGIEFYRSEYFNNYEAGYITGDISPEYLYYERAAKRIKKLDTNVNIFIILRNPIDRTFSEFYGRKKRGDEDREFIKCINNDINIIQKDKIIYKHDKFKKYYLIRSCYTEYIEYYRDLFNKNIHYILFEELIDQPKKIYNKILNIINADISFTPKDLGRDYNSGHKKIKSEFLNKLLWDDNIKNKIKKILPVKRKYLILLRRFFSSINEKFTKKKEIPSKEKEILKNYFYEEYLKIKNIFGDKLELYWDDFCE